jgi:hypothetical protein
LTPLSSLSDSQNVGKQTGIVQYNYTAAFLAFANGATVEELSQTFSIPINSLENTITQQNWRALAARLPRSPEPHGSTSAKLAVIADNRERNFKIACDLRDDILDVVAKMRSPEGLTLEKQWHNRGSVTRAEVPMSLSDRVALASYFKMVADLTYRALGDKDAAEGGAQDVSPSQSAPPSITIILPGVIAKPRANMDLASANVTVDLSKETPTVSAEPPTRAEVAETKQLTGPSPA